MVGEYERYLRTGAPGALLHQAATGGLIRALVRAYEQWLREQGGAIEPPPGAGTLPAHR